MDFLDMCRGFSASNSPFSIHVFMYYVTCIYTPVNVHALFLFRFLVMVII